MKRIIFCSIAFLALFAMLPTLCFAQKTLSNAINNTSISSVPFNMTKKYKIPRSSYGGGFFVNPNDTIPGKLYTNLQLSNYVNASDEPEQGSILSFKFNIPNSNRVLLVVSFGHLLGGDLTRVLCVANPDGTIVSTLLGTVAGADAFVKQFRINAQYQIIVTTIIPYSTTSIPFSTFTSFDGHRRDITYAINNQGQFIQVAVQNYYGKAYSRVYLEDRSKNLWDGGESPY